MKIIHVLCVCAFALPVNAQTITPPDEAKTIGRTIPDATLIDDQGVRFALYSLLGEPFIISPVFTRCPHTCTLITTRVRDATAPVHGLGTKYNILTISFDPGDTAVDLARYRERLDLPAGWRLAVAAAADLAPLLDALDFHVAPVEDGFAHPNVIAVIDGDGKISRYLDGLTVTEGEVRHALTAAWVGDSLVRKYRFWITGIAVLSALATAVVVFVTGRRSARARPA